MDTPLRGYEYEVKNFDKGSQTIKFIKRAPTTPESKELETIQDGTTNEAVIEVLIDRLSFLDNLMPSPYNKKAIQSLTDARTALEERTADREKREVEGTHQA